MEKRPSQLRRQLHKQAKRKSRRWEKALSALESSIALIFATDEAHPVPLDFLPLLKVKRRIEDLNLLLALARGDGELPEASGLGEGEGFLPSHPPVLRDKTPVDLARFKSLYRHGQGIYRLLISRSSLRPASGEGWAVLNRADLAMALPINLLHTRRRERYVVQAECDQGGRIVTIKAWSQTWFPVFERRIHWPDSTSSDVPVESASAFLAQPPA